MKGVRKEEKRGGERTWEEKERKAVATSTHTICTARVTWGHDHNKLASSCLFQRLPPNSGCEHSQRSSTVAKHDYHSVLCLSYLAQCRRHRGWGILKTRTRGGEKEGETRGLMKERNKWNRGGGGWRGKRKRECLRRVRGMARRLKLKSEQGGSWVRGEKRDIP